MLSPDSAIILSQSTRFARTIALLGEEKFTQLQNSFVTLVGVGAVGGHVLEGLVRAGIGKLRIVDFDTIEPTNLNRQILALHSTFGHKKAEAGKRRALDINPDCQIEALDLFVCEEELDALLDPKPDFLIDAIDSLNPKVQLLYGAHTRGIPLISSMGAALRTDPTCIQHGDLFTTSGCPLARHVRKRLRRRGIDSGIPCVFSTEKVNFDYPSQISAEEPTTGRIRHTLGSLPTITGIFGLTIANKVILELTKNHPLTNRS